MAWDVWNTLPALFVTPALVDARGAKLRRGSCQGAASLPRGRGCRQPKRTSSMELRLRKDGGAEAVATVVLAGSYAALASPPRGGGCQGWNRRAVATVALWMAWWMLMVVVTWVSSGSSGSVTLEFTVAPAAGDVSCALFFCAALDTLS